MRHDVQVALIKQLIERLDSDTNVDAGRIRPQSTSTYTDSAQAERERRLFFRGTPQCVGLSGDLPGPGSFITSNDVGTPILATRNTDGQFQAFVNSCRHRGAIVETEARGTARRFTCRSTPGATTPTVPWSACPSQNTSARSTRSASG